MTAPPKPASVVLSVIPKADATLAEPRDPLGYMLGVDPTAEPSRRDEMAVAAAQYVHVEAAPPAQRHIDNYGRIDEDGW